MVRTLTAVFFALFATAAMAQTAALVPSAPTYEDRETGPTDARLFMPGGTIMRLSQKAERGPDGKVYVNMTAFNSMGAAVGTLVMDPRTLLGYKLSKKEKVIMESATCGTGSIYPITLDKRLECDAAIVINGSRRLTYRTSSKVNEVELDSQKRVVGYCIHSLTSDGKAITESRACFSGNGKWIRSFSIISPERIWDI